MKLWTEKTHMLLSYTAMEKDRGRTVYSIVRGEMHVSHALARRMKMSGAISVSGAPVYANFTVLPGQTVVADVGAVETPCDNIPETGPIDILFENDGLIAVNKPAGIIVHPSRSRNSGTLSNFVAGHMAAAGCIPSCHAVNRLDRDTTGVVLFAKNSHMKARASAALADRNVVKEYAALVYGRMPARGVIDLPIRRLVERNMLRVVSPDGQRAVTHYETIRVLKAGGSEVSLLRLRLETGRTHQIRVHCLHEGHPILGDTLYNTDLSKSLSQTLGIMTQALHAWRLGFTEPLGGEFMMLTAPPPGWFLL